MERAAPTKQALFGRSHIAGGGAQMNGVVESRNRHHRTRGYSEYVDGVVDNASPQYATAVGLGLGFDAEEKHGFTDISFIKPAGQSGEWIKVAKNVLP